MSLVRLLTGDIAPESMGFTYSHEHIMYCPAYWVKQGQEDLLPDDPVKNEEEAWLVKLAGVDITVDTMAIDYRRDPEAVYQISLHTGMQVIGATGSNKGFLRDVRMPGGERTYREQIDRSSVEELTRSVIDEVEVGVQDTRTKSGQMESGTDYNSTSPLEIKTIRAGCWAYLETGAPVRSYMKVGITALEQIKYIRGEGMDLSYVSFRHIGRNPDTYYHLKIASTGVFLCFDGTAKVEYNPEPVRVGCTPELAKRGHQEQILVSGDMARRSYYRSCVYVLGLLYVKEVWAERLVGEAEMVGLDGRALAQDISVSNPERCFTFKKRGGVGRCMRI